ncbi:MAG: hypothetical protein MUF01_00815 [Bryobacterales bacterium]|jgi:hypothetical protein|nr:hypothetical protein [Bryobacterales bacterium]
MAKLLIIALCALTLGVPLLPAGSKGMSAQDTKTIREAFDALYRFQFDKAHRAVDRFVAVHPDDPLGYAVRSSVALFQELDRLSLLEGEFFKDDEKIKDSKRLKPDPAIRQLLFQNIAKSQALAEARLAKDASDTNALFCMTVTEGLRMDYLALVDKKHAASLKHARTSQSYAVRLLKVDPEFYDVYCTTGFSEYLLGSLPFFMRWFIKFEDTEGNKDEGLRKLQIAATKGDYFKPFAKLLLAIFFLRQKEPEMSERYLAQYEALYPENPLVRKERKKLMELIASRQAAQQLAR